MVTPIPRLAINTSRLKLRPTCVEDARIAFAIQSDWQVTRMLRMAPFPPNISSMQSWFEMHEEEWQQGSAYRFAIIFEDQMVGIADINRMTDGQWDIGYWLAADYSGKGIATEAAEALLAFAFQQLDISELISGHAVDNPASGHVLMKLGFVPTEITSEFYLSRKEYVDHQSYRLMRDEYQYFR